MNKKFLRFLALGLLISSPVFSSENGKGKKRIQQTNFTTSLSTTNIEKANKPVDSDDEDAVSNFDMTGYSNVMRMFKDQAEIPEPKIIQQLANMSTKDAWSAIRDDDQSSIASSIMPGAKKKNKKKKGGSKDSALVLTVQNYYDPLNGEIITIEQTVEAMQALLKKYSAIFGLLKREQSNTSKKKRFPQDSQNKLTAYEKAQNKVRATIKDLKQNAGSKKAAIDMKQRTETENAFHKSLEGKAQVAAEKRKLKSQEKKAIILTPARPTIMSNQEQARIDAACSMINQQIDRSKKFLFEQNLPYDKDMTKIFYMITDYMHFEGKTDFTIKVHACPVHGEIHTKPCTIRLAKNQEKSIKEREMQERHERILSHWIESAQSGIDGEKPFDFRGENTSGSPIYDLFTAFARKVQESEINNEVGNMGSVADRFKYLLRYKFEHVESEESPIDVRVREYTTLDNGSLQEMMPVQNNTPLLEQRVRLFNVDSKENMENNMISEMPKQDIFNFAIRLKGFAQQVSSEDRYSIVSSFVNDKGTASEPIEVNWCPACLTHHTEKVKIQTRFTKPQDQKRLEKLYEIIKANGEEQTLGLLPILAYNDWHHAE